MFIYTVSSSFAVINEVEVSVTKKCYISASGKRYKMSEENTLTEGLQYHKFRAYSLNKNKAGELLKLCIDAEIASRQAVIDTHVAEIERLNARLPICGGIPVKRIED